VPWEGPPPPYRIETERLVIRCYDPRDAALLKDAVDSSLEHLRAWMQWAENEPLPIEQKLDLLRRFRSAFDAGEDFSYGIFDASEQEQLGGIGLMPRTGPGGLEIGYWVRAGATRQGVVTEAAAAVTRVGLEVCGAERIEIRVDPDNTPSLGVPRKLGFVHEATLRRRLPTADGQYRDVTIWSMFPEDLDPALAPGIRAFDARGERLI
jgi:RimJ/RimL family protein N-acetyltransferase